MDIQKQKLKNRLILKFQPNVPHPSHRYSLKKISLDRKHLDRSSNEQDSQSIMLGNSRNKSISNLRLPSLQKIGTQAATTQISPVKKDPNQAIMNLLAAKEKIKSSSVIRLNKLQRSEHILNTSNNNANIVGNMSKFNYGQNGSIPSGKNILQMSIGDESILARHQKEHESILSNKISLITSNHDKSVHDASILSSFQQQKPKLSQNPTRISIGSKKKIEQIPIPKVKVESKSSIHQTLTYLIKNQILTVPKIVALLQKSHSDQFLYMKIRGIYQFEVCDQQEKGKNFVTVSRNGMVIDGEMIPLEIMVHEFENYKKLRKIPFFRHFLWAKFMNIWNKGSKKAHFVQNRNSIYKLLNLQNNKMLKWNLQFKQILSLAEQKSGSIRQKWIYEIAQSIEQKRHKIMGRMARMCYEIMSMFDLPISDSTELMNKVLHDLNALNIPFDVKIKIQKELENIYKMGRSLEFYFVYFIGEYVLKHIRTLNEKIQRSTKQYLNIILKPLESLKMDQESYIPLKEQILINSPLNYDIDFKMEINPYSEQLIITPTAKDIHNSILKALKEFYNLIEKQSFKLIRNDEFKFIQNVINRTTVNYSRSQLQDRPITIKEHVLGLKQYLPLLEDLQFGKQQLQQIFLRRQQLNKPFLQLYLEFKDKNSKPYTQDCFVASLQNQLSQIKEKISLSLKIHEGQFFVFGYMDQSGIKNLIMKEINQYQEKIFSFIPEMSEREKVGLQNTIKTHLKVLNTQITSPDIYIEVVQQSEKIEQKLAEYSSKILQLQKIGQVYFKACKRDLPPPSNQKALLGELRSKIKNFKQRKESIYMQYRRQLELKKKAYVQRIEKLSLREEEFYNQSSSPELVHGKIKEIIKFLTQLNSQIKHFNQLQIFYNLKETIIPKLQVLIVEYESLQEIWKFYKDWQSSLNNHLNQNIFKISANKEVLLFDSYLRKIDKYIKNIEYFELCKYLEQNILIYLESIHFISQVQFENLRQQDFDEINKLVTKQWQKITKKQPLSAQKILSSLMATLSQQNSQIKLQLQINVRELTLKQIIQKKLYHHKHVLEEITFKCRKQLEIKEMIDTFEFWWKHLKLTYQTLDDYPLIYIFDSNDHVRRQVDQYTTILLNILNHKYGTFIRKECTNHLKNMGNLTQMLRLTIQHQQKFLSLYPILTSKYAEKQLMTQYKKFQTILQKTMKNVRWLVKPTQSINQQTKAMLLHHIKNFDSILKYLSDFLEKKRIKFQRFYFLQDNQMLELLVGNQNENHIFRMFEGIRGWLEDQQQIKIGVVGVGGEQLRLKGWVYKNNEPESMFRSLQEAIKLNLNSIVRKTLHSYENEMKQLRTLYPNMPWMCIYTVELILYTKQIELNCFYDKISFQMQKSLIRQTITAASASPKDNSNYITLLLFLLHFTEQLQKQNVTSVFHFEWYSFLKYYHQHNNVVMRCLGDQHHWGGEYQGLWNLMINTSDIRRVNTCVLSNLKNANGVLLQGPAGTGKTESLKELSRCMAKYCVIFNCSNEVNVQTLEKLLSGLCYTASWICLDEVNRLTAQIMSVIANQINTVKNALVSGKHVFNFMGKKIHLKKGVGVFSTMNPIYLQRAKLTQNLKSYFRVISVNAPDYQKILQVMLYSLNYSHASEHALKISKLFKNLSIQLGSHSQYDFGMRAIKIFVKNLSKHKKLNRKEEETIYHALYQTFYSRLNPSDKNTFSKVIKDVIGFSIHNHQIHGKVQSIKLSTQTGTIILGPTSCKTTLISQYVGSFQNQKIDLEIFNTNSLDPKYLLGEMILGRWNPGIIEILGKKSLENERDMHVLILDNKLKSEVIQNFNTLLDQSKLLTLSNGTRLKIHQNFKLIMETPDLAMTSPATITRCHVVYVNQKDVQKMQIIESVLPNLNYNNNQRIASVFKNFEIDQILRIGKIYSLIWNVQIPHKVDQMNRKIIDRQKVLNLNENQMKGLQKVIFYTIQLLDLSKKVKGILTKENTIPLRRSANNFYINFEKYQEGEFVEILNLEKPQKIRFNYFIPTTASYFCEIITKHAVKKNLPLLWYGKAMTGKSTSIKRSIKRAMESLFPSERKYIKIPIDKKLSSKNITKILDDNMSVKNQIVTDDVIIYVENLNMCNQESEQLLRYIIEYQNLFTEKTKSMIRLPAKLAKIADGKFFQTNKISRLTRHFAQIEFPELSENQINDLYSHLIKLNVAETRTTSFFKENLSIQIDKISVFLNDYVKKKNKLLTTNPQEHHRIQMFSNFTHFSHLSLISVLQNLSFINEKFVKDPSDFMQFLLCELRKNQVQLVNFSNQEKFKVLDTLKLAFNQSYKQKFEQAYNRSLKNVLGHPKQISFFSGILTGNIQKTNWQAFKIKIYESLQQKYYLSEFMVIELIHIVRTLEYRGGNYIMIGKEGLGKKNIFKMAAQICNCKYNSFDGIEKQKIPQTYFSVLKEAFVRDKKSIVVIDANSKVYQPCLLFFERLRSGYPLKYLFKSEDVDEAFALMEHSESMKEEQSISSYDQVVKNFFKLANTKIHVFISCRVQSTKFTLQNHHNLTKDSTIRLVDDFPSDSIIEISLKILQQNMLQKQNAKRLSSVFLKLYDDLVSIIDQNTQTKGFSYFKHNAICHFKLIESYTSAESKIAQKIKKKDDSLNRAIMKVQQTQKILEKVKLEIDRANLQIKKRQQIISEYLPIFQDKKNKYETLKDQISLDKKEITFRQQQAQTLALQIQDQIKGMEPFIKETHDCILSIKKSDLADLKSSPSIHPLLKFAIQNLVILFGEEETDENIKKLLSDTNLMSRLKNCTAKAQDYTKVRSRIQQRQDWNFDSLSKIVFNLRYLFKVTMNTIRTSEIKHKVNQLKAKLQKINLQILVSQSVVQKKYTQLMVIEAEFNIVEEKYIFSKTQLNILNEKLSQNIRKLKNADKIKKSLDMYTTNWKQKINEGKEIRKNLESITSIYAYFLQIHPFLQFDHRRFILERLKTNLKKGLFSVDDTFDPFAYLKQELLDCDNEQEPDEDQLTESKNKKYAGLYTFKNIAYEDSQSENIVHFLKNFTSRPIIFDPDNQALKWLYKKAQSKGSEQNGHNIIITRSSFASCHKSVELAIKEGYLLVLLIEDFLDDFTVEILNSKVTNSMNRKLIEYNKSLLYIHPNFNIILCNKSRRPNPSVSFFISHQVINFQITRDFLKKQLMNQLLIVQNQTLYKNKILLELQSKANYEQLDQIQDSIIESLISNKREIIDDDKLVEMLQKGQEKVLIIMDDLKQIKEKMANIENQIIFFENICHKASDVYLSLQVMSRMNVFFSWNVQIFIKYFLDACLYSISKPLFNDEDYGDDFSYGEFGNRFIQNYQFQNYIGHGNSRATSALSYVSAVTSKVMLQDRKEDFDQEEVSSVPQDFRSARKKQVNFAQLIGAQELFTQDDKKGIMNKQRQEKIIQRLLYFLKHSFNQSEKRTWALVLSLIQCVQSDIKLLFNNSKRKEDIKDCIEDKQITKRMKSIFTKLESNSKVFANQIVIHPTPFLKYGNELSQVEILLLCKILKPERFHQLVIQLIQSKGYYSILEYEKVDVSDWLTVSDCVHPILLMMGEDPLPKLTEYFGSKNYRNVILLAMGQGQSKIAQIVLQKQSKKQNIVIIHNLHISPEFYGFLSKTLQQFQTKRPHNNFRLILITSIHYPFNISIASSCHKFLVMHPNGIGNQMQYLYENLPVELIQPNHKKLAYSICFFHSFINQLQKYQSLGWTIPYEFNTADFTNAIKILKQIVQSPLSINNYECNIDQQELKEIISHQIDFEALRYLIGEVNYVGKLANQFDRQKMRIYIHKFMNAGILQSGFRFFKKYSFPSKFTRQEVLKSVEQIVEKNGKMFGLHEEVKPFSESIQSLLINLKPCYAIANAQSQPKILSNLEPLPSINHKLQFLNVEIQNFNRSLIEHQNQSTQQSESHFDWQSENYQLLKEIKTDTRVFDLRAFSNPHQLFVQIQKEAALRLQIEFEKVEMIWAWTPRDNIPCYGIKNLKLEGATISRKQKQNWFWIDNGKQECNITLYFYGVQRKKKNEVQSNRKMVRIPLYMNQKRQGQINSYGDNTNLLTMVSIESVQDEETWILRSAAFIAGPSQLM